MVKLLALRLVLLLILLLNRDRRRAHDSMVMPPTTAAWLVLRVVHGVRRAFLRRHVESRLVQRLRLSSVILTCRLLMVQLEVLGGAVEKAGARRGLIRHHVDILLALIHGARAAASLLVPVRRGILVEFYLFLRNNRRKVALLPCGVRAALRRNRVASAQFLNDLLIEYRLLLAFENHVLLLGAHVTHIVHVARLRRLRRGAHLFLAGLALADLARPLLGILQLRLVGRCICIHRALIRMLGCLLLLVFLLLLPGLLKLLNVLVAFQRKFELLGRLWTALEHHLLAIWRCLIGVERRVSVLLFENNVCRLDGCDCLLIENLTIHPRVPLRAQLINTLLDFKDLLAAEGGQVAAVRRLSKRFLVFRSSNIACHLDGNARRYGHAAKFGKRARLDVLLTSRLVVL